MHNRITTDAGRVAVLAAATLAFVMLSTNPLAAEELPEVEPGSGSVCVETPDGETKLIRCDYEARTCLIAALPEVEERGPDGEYRFIGCEPAAAGTWAKLQRDGYTLTGARLAPPYGYEIDENGRYFQTRFDLRRRFFVGVDYTTVLDSSAGAGQSVRLELGASYEANTSRNTRRHRYRFLEGALLAAPFEVDALLFAFDYSRNSLQPDLWITTFFGTPKRYDISLDIGPGLEIGRVWYGSIADEPLALVDLGQGHLNWDILQSANMEDYLYLRAGGGLGLRATALEDEALFYLYPKAAIGGAWRIDDRGLWEVGGEVEGRRIIEFEGNEGGWWEARAKLRAERVMIALNDQPISAFVSTSYHFVDADFGERSALRIMAGGRVSFFVPAPKKRWQ